MALPAKHPGREKPKKRKKEKNGDSRFTKTDIARISDVVEKRPEQEENGKWTRTDLDRLSEGLTIPGARRRLKEKAKSPALDAARLAKNVAPAAAQTPEDVKAQKRWERNPTRMDFEGVDSPYGTATIGEPSASPEEAKEKHQEAVRRAKASLNTPRLKVDRPDKQDKQQVTDPEEVQPQVQEQEASTGVSQETAEAQPQAEQLEVQVEVPAGLQPQAEERVDRQEDEDDMPEALQPTARSGRVRGETFRVEGVDLDFRMEELGSIGKWVVRGENGMLIGVGDSRGEAQEDAASQVKKLGEETLKQLLQVPRRGQWARARASAAEQTEPTPAAAESEPTPMAPEAEAIVQALQKEVQDERAEPDRADASGVGGSGVQPADRRISAGASPDVSEGEPTEGLQEDAEERGVGKGSGAEVRGDQEVRAEPDRDRDASAPGVELGDTSGDTRSGDGLEGRPAREIPATGRDFVLPRRTPEGEIIPEGPAPDEELISVAPQGNPAFQHLAATPVDLGRDFILDPTKTRLPRTATERWNANLNAIRLSKQLDEQDLKPTPEEQAVLAMFSGFGDSTYEASFKGYGDQDWVRRGVELRELVTDDEFKAIERSRLNAFYTTPEVINTTWKALERMGVDKIAQPRVLEPSAGSGRYLGLQPTDLAARSKRTAVELDTMTGNILKRAYPNTATFVMGFQEAPIADDSIDVAVSNVPFGSYPVFDPSYLKGRDLLTKQIHNYFFAKTLDKLRPGGVLGFVTSHFTLDAPTALPIREALAEKADFLGAIRLPQGAFPDTQVVTDIIFMQKREPGEEPGDTSWVNTSTVRAKGKYGDNVDVDVNQYFLDNPDMVLGEHAATGSMYAKDSYTVIGKEGENLGEAMLRAVERLPADVISDGGSWERDDFDRGEPAELDAYSNVPVGSYVIGEDDNVVYVRTAHGLEKATLPKNKNSEARVRDMLAIRDSAREVLQLQREDRDDADVAEAQSGLNAEYDAFVEKYGRLNDKNNTKLMKSDPEGPFLRSLEESSNDKENPGWNKMPIFSKRVLKGAPDRIVNSPADAMAVALDQEGHLDFEVMGSLLGQSPDEVRNALAEQKLVFKNPVGDWETADDYLSGNVRDKLGTAILASTADPSYQGNIDALQTVQPEELPASAIQVSFGAPWVPPEDYSAFVSELLDAPRSYNYRTRKDGVFYKFAPSRGTWIKNETVRGAEGLDRGKWGTEDMAARDIIWKMLQGSPIEVKRKDGEGVEYRDEVATAAALEKAEQIGEEFDRWIWEDPKRAARLTQLYNDKFNDSRSREYDGQHLTFPGMNVSWAKKLHSHQRDAIWRVVQDGTVLLAHEVGFGKTAVMVGAGMEMRRLGMARKPAFVVPKATHEQFRRQFQELYPHAKVLFPGPDDFKGGGARPEFTSRVATGDWDAVMLSYEQFKALPVKPETEAEFTKKEINALRAAMIAEAAEGGGKTPTHKNLQNRMIKLEVDLKKLMNEARDKSDKTIHFEDLGIDQLFVDEADNFKNLKFVTKMDRVKGLPKSESKRAWDMYMKVRYLQNKGKGRGVVFATGTPIANTIAELWTMMRYLQEPELERRGLEHFDSWARTFGGTTNAIEQSPTGKYRMAQRFAKFMNVPELATLWQKTADVRVASEVPQIMERLPRLADPNGNAQRTVITAPGDDQLKNYMMSLGERAGRLNKVDPHVDNMLKISSDARKAALDMRMVDPNADPNPNGKIPLAARNIAQIYKEEEKEKGTQLVFLDIATPKAKDKIDDGGAPDDDDLDFEELTGEEAQLLKDVYNVMRNQLIANGVAEKDIAFIHDAATDDQRADLFKQVNNGDKRVLIGSTGKLGVGVNVQERAAAAHHLDVPWRPRDIEQREGRIIRQGNKVYGPEFDQDDKVVAPGKGVRIFNYVTEGSFDAYMWQAVEVKAKAIKSIMKRNIRNRTMEDIDALVLSASEAKALASGNPDVLKAVEVKNEVSRLQLLRASHRDAVARAQRESERLPTVIEGQRSAIGRLERDVELVAKTEDDKFAMTVAKTGYAERTKAGEAVKRILDLLSVDTSMPPTRYVVGTFRGFNVQATRTDMGYMLHVSNPETGMEHISTHMDDVPSAVGVVSRIENVVKSIPGRLESTNGNLQKTETSLRTYEEQAAKPFEHTPRLQQLEGELQAVEEKLKREGAASPGETIQGTGASL